MDVQKKIMLRALFFTALLAGQFEAVAQKAPPESWIDPDTGHRMVRLTSEPNSASLYFNQNGYTPGGKKLVYTTWMRIGSLDYIQTPSVMQHFRADLHLELFLHPEILEGG